MRVHLADGILQSPALLGGAAVISAAGLALALRDSSAESGAKHGLAFTGTLAAVVLAVQALNVPLFPGVSAHAIGASLLVFVLGPARAIIALTAVLLAQALLFADGGLTALGINVLNIALLPVVCVTAVRRLAPARLGLQAVLGTTLGNLAGSLCLAAMLVVGAGAEPRVTFGVLVGVQAISGLVEGALTAAAVSRIARRAPALVRPSTDARVTPTLTRAALAWTVLALGVLVLLLPFASASPDALEVVLDKTRLEP